jgi:hypothetical protein
LAIKALERSFTPVGTNSAGKIVPSTAFPPALT